MQSLTGLLEITAKPSQGPSPTFTSAHLLLAFITIGESRLIGRQLLAMRSGLKEGAIRTILKKLREDGYVGANASGCYLTPSGRRVYDSMWKRFSPIVSLKGSSLTMGAFQAGLAVRGGGTKVKSGIEQRDSAIKLKAEGATTFVMKSGKFTIPGGSADCEKDFPSRVWSKLRDELEPKNGDALILCGAADETTCRLGALSAALTLL